MSTCSPFRDMKDFFAVYKLVGHSNAQGYTHVFPICRIPFRNSQTRTQQGVLLVMVLQINTVPISDQNKCTKPEPNYMSARKL